MTETMSLDWNYFTIAVAAEIVLYVLLKVASKYLIDEDDYNE